MAVKYIATAGTCVWITYHIKSPSFSTQWMTKQAKYFKSLYQHFLVLHQGGISLSMASPSPDGKIGTMGCYLTTEETMKDTTCTHRWWNNFQSGGRGGADFVVKNGVSVPIKTGLWLEFFENDILNEEIWCTIFIMFNIWKYVYWCAFYFRAEWSKMSSGAMPPSEKWRNHMNPPGSTTYALTPFDP